MAEQILMTAGPSPVRRAFGLIMLGVLTLVLFVLALLPVTVFGQKLVLLLLAVFVGACTIVMFRATRLALELTDVALRDSSGAEIALLDHVQSVDRSSSVLKPSHGFVLYLTESPAPRFRPGLYWIIGRRVGVGGVLSSVETRQLADWIAAIVAARDDVI